MSAIEYNAVSSVNGMERWRYIMGVDSGLPADISENSWDLVDSAY